MAYGLAVTWVAYVDESMRQRHDGKGCYVLAAAVVDCTTADELRLEALGLRRGKRPFHWRLEHPADQRRAVGKLADLDALYLITVGTSLDLRRQERGRLKCLEQLLWALQTDGVALAMQTRIGFANCFNGSDGEPLLWLADAAAGAASAAYGGGDNTNLELLRSKISQEIVVDLA